MQFVDFPTRKPWQGRGVVWGRWLAFPWWTCPGRRVVPGLIHFLVDWDLQWKPWLYPGRESVVTSPGVVSDIVGGKKWIPLSDVEGMSPALRGDGGRVWGRGAESSLRPRFPHWININQLCRGGGLEDPIVNVLSLMCSWGFQGEVFRAVGHLGPMLSRKIWVWGQGLGAIPVWTVVIPHVEALTEIDQEETRNAGRECSCGDRWGS